MAVLIPSQFARMRKIAVGTVIDLEPVLVIGSRRRRYKLAELVAQFEPSHRHREWDLGRPVGKEVW
jgi:antitoxin component of MazEF toxin-antitoxin module